MSSLKHEVAIKHVDWIELLVLSQLEIVFVKKINK
jgi:hypothetical protein